MRKWPLKMVVDTNVPKTANMSISPENIPHELAKCVDSCVDAILCVTKRGGLVIDSNDLIFHEYRQNLRMSGQPGVGDMFMKWVHDNRFKFPDEDRVPITEDSTTYREFPTHEGLNDFDPADRKFVSVANAHPNKPPILQATDSKWWGWKNALKEVGLNVDFLCPDYVKNKYEEKFGS